MLIFPAISLMGVKQGNRPTLSRMVSYAIATIPLSMQPCVSSVAGRKVKIGEHDLSRREFGDLVSLGFLHFDDHFAVFENL